MVDSSYFPQDKFNAHPWIDFQLIAISNMTKESARNAANKKTNFPLVLNLINRPKYLNFHFHLIK